MTYFVKLYLESYPDRVITRQFDNEEARQAFITSLPDGVHVESIWEV